MKEAEKFLKENKLSDEILNWDDEKRDAIYLSEIMQKYADQQLIIHVVSNQMELLQCFCELTNITHDTVNQDIEDTIHKFNAL